MKTKLLLLGCCASLAFFISGCSKKPEVDTTKLESSFATAEPADKSEAAKAVDAVKARDYDSSLASLKRLAQQAKLTPEQKAAIHDVSEQVQMQLKAAFDKAKEGGKKALEDVKEALPKSQ